MNTLDISSFLTPLFERVKSVEFLWCVARGWEGLPEYTRHDVDLYVEERGYGAFRKAVYEVAEQTGWRVFKDCRKSIYRPILLLKTGLDGSFKFIQLDIFVGAVLKGVAARTDFVDMLSKRWLNNKGIWCCNLGYMGVRILLKELVQNGKLGSAKREAQVLEGLNGDALNFERFLLSELQNKELVSKIIIECNNSNWSNLERLSADIRRSMPKVRIKDILRTISWSWASLRVRIRPFFRFFVVLVGPDGCGKTTVADAIEKYMDCNPFSLTYRIHSSFGFVPRLRNIYAWLAKLMGKKVEFKADPKPGTKLMGMQKPLGRLRAIFYVTYYGMGLILSRIKIFRMYPYFTMILADRYFYDYYYMRGYIKCPNWYKRIFEVFIPKPDLILFLNRDAQKIFSQKPELSVEEIVRQQKAIQACVGSRAGFVEINGDDGVAATVGKVIGAISERLKRYK